MFFVFFLTYIVIFFPALGQKSLQTCRTHFLAHIRRQKNASTYLEHGRISSMPCTEPVFLNLLSNIDFMLTSYFFPIKHIRICMFFNDLVLSCSYKYVGMWPVFNGAMEVNHINYTKYTSLKSECLWNIIFSVTVESSVGLWPSWLASTHLELTVVSAWTTWNLELL